MKTILIALVATLALTACNNPQKHLGVEWKPKTSYAPSQTVLNGTVVETIKLTITEKK